MEKLQKRLGYTFKNPQLLRQALTHSSYTADIHLNYERLEFLGDRILGLTVAEMLCETFVNEPEGNLSQRFVTLVCKNAVADVMKNLDVQPFIIAHDRNVKDSANVLCDIGEALIAAIYRDSGSIVVAQDFIRRQWTPLIDRKSHPHKDFKTLLQEVVCHKNLDTPQYHMLKKSGPEHEPVFHVQVDVGHNTTAEGEGQNIKTAEQNAAHNLLSMLGETDA